MLCASFPGVPVVALTATASKMDILAIKDSLNLKNPLEVIANPNRPNIFYEKVFYTGDDTEFFEQILGPIAAMLKESTVQYPLTILYLPLRWCGFAFKYFERQLGSQQYHPSNAEALPENRLFAQFHSPQTNAMKDQILKELASPISKVRVIFTTVAMGMGVDIPSIRQIIHVGPPRSIREYFQETRRAGRDGRPSTAVLYYNNRNIAKNREGMSEDIRTFCRLDNACLRKFLLKCLDARDVDFMSVHVGHLCCSYCKALCHCPDCLKDKN